MTSGASSSGDAETTSGEVPLEGPGCGEPPPCDRGSYEGHALIESEADLASFEGYTEITGFLQIANSQDLVCLDRLACLEVVGRDLRIQQNAALQSTEGLRNLRKLGAAYGPLPDPTIYVAENASLERLRGLGVTRSLIAQLVLWKNPALVAIEGPELPGLRSLSLLENPRLESLGSLQADHSVRCYVNRNPLLCMSELDPLCYPNSAAYPRSYVYDGTECTEGDTPPVVYDSVNEDCSIQLDDCPEGEKCMPVNTTGRDRVECRPLVAAPRGLGESCEQHGAPLDGLDDCGPRAYCSDGRCHPLAFGPVSAMVCPGLEYTATTDADGYFNLCTPNCDPFEDACPDGQVCVPLERTGVFCVDARAEPRGQLCDVTASDCPAGRECVSWWNEGDLPVPKVEHVGLCVDS